MLDKKIAAAMLLGILVLTSALAIAQEPGEEPSLEPKNSKDETDSRSFDVERACMADQVTVKTSEAWTSESGGTYEEAVKKCVRWLTLHVWLVADGKCKKFYKIDTYDMDNPDVDDDGIPKGDPCRAHRGNFDPTTNVKVNYSNKDKKTGVWTVGCEIKQDVKYTCN